MGRAQTKQADKFAEALCTLQTLPTKDAEKSALGGREIWN